MPEERAVEDDKLEEEEDDLHGQQRCVDVMTGTK